MNDLMVDDAPDDPAIITLHAHRIPRAKNDQDKLNDLYGPQSPPAYVSSIGGFVSIILYEYKPETVGLGPMSGDDSLCIENSLSSPLLMCGHSPTVKRL